MFHYTSQVYRHELGSNPADDMLVYEETDKRFVCSVWISLSAEYVFISSDTSDQSEVWFIPTSDIQARPTVVEPRTSELEYSVEHQGDRFLILTNADGASDFKIVETPCVTPGRGHWRDWLAHQSGRMILDLYAYRDWVMWMERENALPQVCYRHTAGHLADSDEIGNSIADNEKVENEIAENETAEYATAEHAKIKSEAPIHRIQFSEAAYALSLEPLLEFDECAFRLGYESPSTPAQIFSYDMQSGSRDLLKEDLTPPGMIQQIIESNGFMPNLWMV